jgi:DNA-binding CsgD family transcriptional regulator/PAS domain-containing protein
LPRQPAILDLHSQLGETGSFIGRDGLTLVKGGCAQNDAEIFLSAPFSTDGWNTALKHLATATCSRSAQLIAFGSDREIPLNWVTDPEPGFIEEFQLMDGGNPELNWRVASGGRPMEVRWEAHYDQARQRIESDAYDELANRFDLPFGCQTVLFETSEAFYGLASLRSRRDGRTTAEHRAVFGRIAPLVLTAIKLQQSLEHKGASLVAGALEAFGGAIFLLDRGGRVIGRTAAAEDLLANSIGLRLKYKSLVADDADENRQLQSAIHSALSGAGLGDPAPAFWLGLRRDSGLPYLCNVLPLPQRDWSLGHVPCAVLRVKPPSELDSTLTAPLRAGLGLTEAEAEVALMMANGLGRDEIASKRGTTEHTVASQIKQLFQKSSVRRELELTALINRLLR